MNSLTGHELRVTLGPSVDQQPAVSLENLCVRYRAPEERLSTFKEYAIRSVLRPPRYTDFYALQDVSMEVRPGEAFGIIGRNGAGKSTLLKVVSRVLAPTKGRVRIRGRVGKVQLLCIADLKACSFREWILAVSVGDIFFGRVDP